MVMINAPAEANVKATPIKTKKDLNKANIKLVKKECLSALV